MDWAESLVSYKWNTGAQVSYLAQWRQGKAPKWVEAHALSITIRRTHLAQWLHLPQLGQATQKQCPCHSTSSPWCSDPQADPGQPRKLC